MGVEENAVSVLLKDKIGAINYCCCECRMVPAKGRGAGDVTAGYAQLLRLVGCLVNQVRGLVDSSSGNSGNVTNLNGPHVRVSSDVKISRDAIFTEVRELNERDKRKCSIILQGFDCESVNDVCEKFNSICQVLNVGIIELNDIVQIGDRRLFGDRRARILNDEKRKELLLVAKKLKSLKEYEKVYIQKDLTFRQRQELYKRRYRRGVLQSGNRSEIAEDGSVHTVTGDVGHSLVQEGCLDRNVVRGRGRTGGGRGSVRGSGSDRSRGIGKGRSSVRSLFSGEAFGNSQGRVEYRGALVDDGLYATTPHIRRQSLN